MIYVLGFFVGLWAHEGHSKNCAELLKSSSYPKLEETWAAARDKLAVMRSSLGTDGPGHERKHYQKIIDAAEAAVTKHHIHFRDQKALNRLDVARHLEILRTIAGFEAGRTRLSLYRIRRAIEGRHSLNEYIDCL